MQIMRNTYERIIETTPPVPPESGGILGGRDEVITHCFFDLGVSGNQTSYYPDIARLNNCLKNWGAKGLDLYGFYHTHSSLGVSLSECDKSYILKIMKSLKGITDTLLFPIVFPQRGMIVYKASLADELIISEETLDIISG